MTTCRGAWVLFAALCWALPAPGASCGSGERPWVSVAFDGAPFTPEVEARMVEDFRAGLSDRDIDVCAASEAPSGEAVAQIRVAQATATKVGVSVEVRDAVTEKRVTRDVDLSAVPKDGRAFAVAIAADELLRASWVELAIERARRPKRPPPPQVAAVAESVLPERTSPRSTRFGVRAAAERYGGGQSHLGGDASLVTSLLPRLQLELAAGLREGLVEDAPHGKIVASAIAATVTLSYLVLAADGLELGVGAGGRGAWVRFRGEAEGEGTESTLSGLAAYVRAGVGFATRVASPLWLELGANAGVPLRSLGARDGEATITAVSGVELALRAGVAVEF